MKIAIIGNPGSGKSTLALALHAITGIPVYHLDQYYWKPHWQRPNQDDFRMAHHQLCDKDEWIIEGVATRIFEYRVQKADVIIFLDMPTYLCLYRVCKRAFLNYGKEHAISPQGCPEGVPSFELLKFIWNFDKEKRPIILDLLTTYQHSKKVFIVRNKVELHNLIDQFKTN